MKKSIVFLFLLFCTTFLYAQYTPSWEYYYEQLSSMSDMVTTDKEATYEFLAELAEHPINLNSATREDLEQLPFLSSVQIEELVAYINQYAPLQSLGELAMIESLDALRRKLLSFFITIDSNPQHRFPSFKNIVQYGKYELLLTGKIPFYKRKGDINGYMGYPFKHWWRYTFSYGQYVKAGVVASQDAGEPWFAGRNKWGYDYYSAYAQIKKCGRIKSLLLGRYRLKMGMGLIINRDFGLGKLISLSSLTNNMQAIRAHSSKSEADYLQGVAATAEIMKGLDLTGFVSYRQIDATLNKKDSSIVNIVTSGYHRTLNEMSRKHNTSQSIVGGRLQYFKNGFHIGVNAIATLLNRTLQPKENQMYRKFSPRGKEFWNSSIDYGYISRRLTLQGETATGNHGAWATLHSFNYQCLSNLSLIVVQRFYSHKYYSLLSRSFSDGGHIQNESGLYVGAYWQPTSNLSLMLYGDWAYFPWATYRASQSSYSYDYMLLGNYQYKKWSLQTRYRLRIQQKDNSNKAALLNTYTHRIRLSWMKVSGRWMSKTQTDGTYYKGLSHSLGYMLTQSIGYQHNTYSLFANVAYFHTQDYNSRLYAYERGMLYTFSFPMFTGKGFRCAVNMRYHVNSTLMLALKLGSTYYLDRDVIGSSYQQINKNTQTNMELQVRCKL